MYQQPGMMPHDAALMQLTPELQKKFRLMDSDNSGRIDVKEIHTTYKDFNFSPLAAKFLLRAITDLPYIDVSTFPAFDFYVTQFYNTYVQFNAEYLQQPQVTQALNMLNFTTDDGLVMSLVNTFGRNQRVDFGQFMAICSYLLLCGRLLTKFDKKENGTLTVDFRGLGKLGLWFL